MQKLGIFTTLTLLLSLGSVLWVLWDAFRPVQGALHYAAGQWVLAKGDIEYAGTIQARFDLQSYLLVYFASSNGPHNNKYRTCIHLERKHMRTTSDWLVLRRAVFAPLPTMAHESTLTQRSQTVTAVGSYE